MIHLLAAVVAAGCLPTADILPPALQGANDLEAREAAGRARLQAAAEASGLEAWRGMERVELTLRDVWVGPFRLFNPWPDADTRAIITQRPGTFDSTARFVGGRRDGWTWGIEDWQTYTIDPDGQRSAVDDGDIHFMLPTTQYFLDLPFRILEAEIVHDVGERVIAGQPYQVVYATWGSVQANRDYDQYLLFVSPASGRIEKVQYTVREMGSFVTGTNHLDDQREVDGIWVPHRMTINQSPDAPLDEGAIHTMYVEAIDYVDEG